MIIFNLNHNFTPLCLTTCLHFAAFYRTLMVILVLTHWKSMLILSKPLFSGCMVYDDEVVWHQIFDRKHLSSGHSSIKSKWIPNSTIFYLESSTRGHGWIKVSFKVVAKGGSFLLKHPSLESVDSDNNAIVTEAAEGLKTSGGQGGM